MSWAGVLAIALGAGLVGAGIGATWGLLKMEQQVQMASNVALAVISVTGELTYGEEWFKEFMEEAKLVMEEHPRLIEDRVRSMRVKQFLRDRVRELEEKYGS